jgi:phosphohistidine phosphatase
MQRLILMRHGDAHRQASGQEDFDRSLTDEGRSESRLIGKALAKAGLAPDQALVSSARRATETWKAAAEAFPKARITEDRSLYAAGAGRLAAAVAEAAGTAKVLMIVGHNPGIHQYAIHLAMQAGASEQATRPLYERFPTGSAVVFAFDADGVASFERLFLARDVRDRRR